MPRNCLVSDYDVQAQAEQIYQEMQWNIPSFWVKDHQDEECDKRKVKWEAILNIKVDELATEARYAITKKQRNAPMDPLPVCSIQLYISGEMITRQIST
eukprot:4895025-Ditylum_brightwellii.AAC.1